MENIQMVDLKNQYLHLKTQIDFEIQKVIDKTAFINGKAVKAFQKQLVAYHRANHAITCANGTDALQIALMALDLKAGDEVIVPAFTYVATAEVIALLNLVPVLVDVDEKTFNIDPSKIEAAISPKTKAIIPVHLFGQSADMEPILKIAHKHNLFVIEDNAQSIGAEYRFSDGSVKKTGTMGDFGCTSFFPSKNLGCYGDGGALITNNPEYAEKARMIANHGQAEKYHHKVIGINSRLDSIQAAVLRVKINKLNEYNIAREQAAGKYDNEFTGIEGLKTPYRALYSSHVFHQYTLQVADGKRDDLKAHLAEKNIPSMIYYPIPLHEQEAFKNIVRISENLKITEKLCKTVLSLPMHTELSPETEDYIIDAVKSFFA